MAERGSWVGEISRGKYRFKVRLFKLEKSVMMAKERIYYKDKTGAEVTKMRVDAVTKKPAARNIDIWVNTVTGAEVSPMDVASYTKVDGVETAVSKFEKTDLVDLSKELTQSQDAELLPYEFYEVIPDSEEDLPAMYEMAKEMVDTKKVLAGTLVIKAGWTKYGLVISPKIDENTKVFSLIAKTVVDKINPKTFFPIPTGKFVPKEKSPTLKVDPFG